MEDRESDGAEYEEELSTDGWIQWFCSLEGHEFFVEVDEEFIKESFNLYGLVPKVPHYREALEMILSFGTPDEDDLQDDKFLELYGEATDLYGMIHARYILSPRGLALMREKYLSGKFGTCPRVMCERQNVIPVGISDVLKTSRVKIFCPRCQEAYIPKHKYSDVDGAYFGASFPHILLQSYSDFCIPPLAAEYTPKIYGFKLYNHKGSKYYEKRSDDLNNDFKKSKIQ
ncbi:unnamed protein product [Blepharisma stoltei]|uniref:Casein kinase II subunit beta n=1 Tax=Blepharisma stoltei TaxID=1481888 RepID=A0AAU9JUW3_9CILI|nr:unnamed protein product [Blepharisma stoltei]